MLDFQLTDVMWCSFCGTTTLAMICDMFVKYLFDYFLVLLMKY